MAQPALSSPDELDGQLQQGAHELMRDAVGNQVMRDSLPIGYVPPGKTLIQFRNLDFPIKRVDYNRPLVLEMLREMLSVRRLSEGAGNALGYRIYKELPTKYGDEGKVMAAMLLSRARQAISEPEVWPSLLDVAELKAAYGAYKGNETSSHGRESALAEF